MAILSESSTPPDRPADLSEDFFSFITTTTAIFPESRIPSEKSGNLSEESSEQSQPAQAKGATPLVSVGPQRYIVVIGAFCALCASFGWRSGSGLFQDYYQLHQLRDKSPSTIAWINSVGFCLTFFGAIFVQPLNLKFGLRRVLFVGSCMHVSGLLATSWCKTFPQFLLAQGILSPLGASSLFFSSIVCLGRWGYNRSGAILGITAAGTSVGGVMFPLMIQQLIPRIGFAWTMRAVTLVILVLSAVSFVALRDPPPNPNFRRPQPPKDIKDRFSALTQRKFILTFIGVSFFISGYFLVLIFVTTVARLRGWMDPVDAIVCLNGASFFGRILTGFFADRWGNYNVMILLSFLSTILIFALWIPGNNVPASTGFSVVFGFFSGSTITLGPAMVLQISELSKALPNMASLYVFESIAALVTSPIGGALLSADDNTNPLFLQIFAGTITAIGTAFIVLARIDQSGLHAAVKM